MSNIYDLIGKTLYCFSDEEGGAPFHFEGEASAGPRDEVVSTLNSAFTFEDGLITSINDPSVALGFLGDLIDNQDHSIRAVASMLKLKSKTPDRVLLIAGNRDFNKIRYGVELYYTVNGALPWEGTTSFIGLYETLSAGESIFRQTTVPPYIQGALAPWNANLAKPNGKIRPGFEGQNFKDRITMIMGPTMGTAGPGMIAKELEIVIQQISGEEMGGKLVTMDETAAKFLCALQMVMSLEWTDLPDYLQYFHALYLRYLEQAHVGAFFSMGEKTGYMSHGGLPYDQKDGILTRGLSAPLGLPYTNANLQPTSLFDMVQKNEQEKDVLIEQVKSLSSLDAGYNNEVHYLIDKFVHLTAGTKAFPYTGDANAYKPYEFAPIVEWKNISKLKNVKVKLRGGNAPSWIAKNKGKSAAEKFRLNFNAGAVLHYNIFGHQPQGFVPTAYSEGETLHVCLDISKTEGATNNYSFAFLVMDGTNANFMGRLQFPATPATIYQNSHNSKDKIIYYIEPIDGNKLKSRKIPGTNVFVEYTPDYKRVVKNAVGGRRVRKTRRANRKTRKTNTRRRK